jgi:predicted CopG family antitoxin
MSKTISIDNEAYRILKSHKLEGENFSDVIKKNMFEALVGKPLDDALRAAALAEKEKKAKR